MKLFAVQSCALPRPPKIWPHESVDATAESDFKMTEILSTIKVMGYSFLHDCLHHSFDFWRE